MYFGVFVWNKDKIVAIDDSDVSVRGKSQISKSGVVDLASMTASHAIIHIHASPDGEQMTQVADSNFMDIGDFTMWHHHVYTMANSLKGVDISAQAKRDVIEEADMINKIIVQAGTIYGILNDFADLAIHHSPIGMNYLSFLEKHLYDFKKENLMDITNALYTLKNFQTINVDMLRR